MAEDAVREFLGTAASRLQINRKANLQRNVAGVLAGLCES